MIVAALIASAWFAFWMFTFTPVPVEKFESAERPDVIRLTAGSEAIRELIRPDIFALPFAGGYSGGHPASNINLRLALDRPASPVHYLSSPEEETK